MKRFFIFLFSLIGIVSFGTKTGTEVTANLNTETMWSVWDLGKPQIANSLFKRYGREDAGLLGWLRSVSFEQAVALDEWSCYEDERTVDTLVVNALVADQGAGNATTFKLSTTKITSGNRFYGREGFIVTIPLTEVQARITTITVNGADDIDITLTPLRATDTIGALSAGMTLAITNGAWAAGTDMPDGASKGAVKRSYVAQIFKEKVGAEGTQLANEKWFDVSSLGDNMKGWYSPALMDVQYRLSVIEDGAYMFGVNNTNSITATGIDSSSNSVKTTKGIIPWTRELGNTISYTVGSWATTDLKTAMLYARTQSAPTTIMSLLTGANLSAEMEEELVDYIATNQGGADFTKIARTLFAPGSESSDHESTGEKYAMEVGFKTVGMYGYQFALQVMGAWSNPKLFGATGYDINKFGLMLPMATVKDAKSKGKINNIASRYRAYNGTNRRYKVFNLVGGGNTLPNAIQSVNGIDSVSTNLIGHHGLQVVGANWNQLFDPA